jgi:hypothetical protein
LIGYKLAKDIVKCPDIYKILPNIRSLSAEILDSLKFPKFVIKAVLGRSANQVLCVEKNLETGQYRDLLRGLNWYESSEIFLQHIFKTIKIKNPHKIIIEEFLGGKTNRKDIQEEGKWIPYDFKLYFVKNKVRLINVYSRGKSQEKFMAMFDRNWNRIPKNKIYIIHNKYPDKVGDIPLPSPVCRQALITKAEKLGRKLKTKICRFDLYCIGPLGEEKIYFGEITTICGGISLHPITPYGLKLLYPPNTRNIGTSRNRSDNNRSKGGSINRGNGKSLYYIGRKKKSIKK